MKRINKSIILILVLVLISFVDVIAQNRQIIHGRVFDKRDQEPIIGATVAEIDSDNRIIGGAATDINGDFIYNMKDGTHMLRVSVIGYHGKDLKAQANKPMSIALESSDIEIDAVIVTAERSSGSSLTNIDERDKASSSVKIDLIEMKDEGVTSVADAMQGKISGLDIISASGDPGSGSQIVIRGLSSIGNNKPLIVIDGIPQNRVEGSVDLSAADQEDISNLINIALQDIKSIEVLKDAGATAIYGSQGADGVLLIETRKGKMGKVKFDYQYKHSMNIQPDPIPMLNGDEYIMLQLEQLHNARGVFDLPSEIAYDPDYVDFHNYSQNTDWMDAITTIGQTKDHYFALSGGGDKTRYSASASYVDEGGTTINTRSRRFSTRINLDYILSKKLMYSVLFSYSNSNRNKNYIVNQWTEQEKNIRQMAYIKAPNMSIWDHDENGNPTNEYFNPINSYQGSGSEYFNPVAVAELGRNDEKEYSIENTFKVRYIFNDWIRFRQTVSFQFSGKKENSFLPYNAMGLDWVAWDINKSNENNSIYSAIRTETQLVFNAPFDVDVHDLSGAFSWVTAQSTWEGLTSQTNRSPSVDLQDPAAGAQIAYVNTGSNESRDLGAVGNINYKLLDRYMLQVSSRLDASSSFGENSRWGLFSGVSMGWRFSQEPFLSGVDWLGESKLRLSWGIAGRQPSDAYARFALYTTSGSGSYVDNPSIAPSSVQLDNLKWENVESLNGGVNINLFNDRLYIETDVYSKTTTDLLFGGGTYNPYPIPYTSGYSGLKYFNGGQMSNKGWELMLNGKVIRTKDLILSVYFNTSHNVNNFTKLPENFNNERSTSIRNGEYPLKVVEGEPIGSFFGFEYLGVWSKDEDVFATDANDNPIYDADGKVVPLTYQGTYTFKGGDAKYKDQNHDGKIDLNDVVTIGDSNPDYIGGFGTSLKYKDFDVSVGFHYRIGFDIINKIANETEGMSDKNNQSKAVLRRWRVQGQDEENMLPRAYEGHPANNLGSDRYVEPGDYLRLNNIKLGYKVPKQFCDKLHVNRMSLTLSARKLLTFTNYSGQDPEIGQDAADPFWIGVDEARTPPSRMFTGSVAIYF
ncbi:MAG: SusC/RagA family TonB-linked outer membrane protein [Prolixibacteraceae bacterium]|nr:SusC/RagA family TonB-linked outer membrane protein [Prolixibacteraceae bacterium]